MKRSYDDANSGADASASATHGSQMVNGAARARVAQQCVARDSPPIIGNHPPRQSCRPPCADS